jgi:hypothetical protein
MVAYASTAGCRMEFLRRGDGHHDDHSDVIAAPADFAVDVSADYGRALLPGKLPPELAAHGSPLPPAVFARHCEPHLIVRGVIALDHANCPGCNTTWLAGACRRQATGSLPGRHLKSGT